MKLVSSLISSLTLLSLNLIGLAEATAQTPVQTLNSTSGFKFNDISLVLLGNGCPSGTSQAVLNGDTLSVNLPQFEAVATSPSVVSKSCNLRVGLNVPAGYKVRPINLNYFGSASVPNGGSAELNVRILFQGKLVPITNDPNLKFESGFSGTWQKNASTRPDAINACNGPVNSVFGVNTNLIARARDVAAGGQTSIRIDRGYRIKFALARC
ncbi:DUF4360 domain-containing protein [Nostoc sp. FACHB-152]|uniref:DUF4360 domain-containing protein n=1 Tax=unclassified Nostoc TaxID=2593658 RepID=UPI0016842BB9|nr:MULTISPECIES: DUF4360 domain-containing protein [unclassified Nostoc]MBD2447960.1 DUF4360 domain-containing protein [Nostoc sp. FACHB-152]MBD2466067.1 DUF4360 domain-containing protein [Nostoc sp. FACHB-145]